MTDPITFETTDSEIAREILSALYGDVTFHKQGPRTVLHTASTVVGRARLDRIDQGMGCDYAVRESADLVVGRLCAGRLRYGARGGATEPLGIGGVFVVCAPEVTTHGHVEQPSVSVVTLDAGLLAEVAGRQDGVPPRFTGTLSASSAAAMHYNRTFDFIVDKVLPNREACDSPLVLDGSGRMLAAAALAMIPNDAVPTTAPCDRNDARPVVVRRAVAYIDANPDLAIGIHDIARAARTTPRAVSLAFRRSMGCTPAEYLSRVRLDLAHGDLAGAGPDSGVSVAAVAGRWGFGHLTGFVARYCDAYSVSPQQTLDS